MGSDRPPDRPSRARTAAARQQHGGSASIARAASPPKVPRTHPDRYCAKGGEAYICTNKQLLAAKAKNQIPSFQSMPGGLTVVGNQGPAECE